MKTVNMNGPARLLQQPVDDAQAKAGALRAGLCAEIRLEDLRHHIRRNPRPVILDGQGQQRSGVLEVIAIDETIFRSVHEHIEIDGMLMELAANLHAMMHRGALKRVQGQVQENLDEVRAVRRHRHVFGERMDEKLVVPRARVNAEQFPEVAENLVDPDARIIIRILAQETEIPPGNLDAIGDLPGDALETIFDRLQILVLYSRRIADPLIDDLEQTRNDRQRTVDVMDDARVNLAPRADDFLLHLQLLKLILELHQLLAVVANLAAKGSALQRTRHRRAHRGEVKGLVDVVARAEPQRLPHRLGRFKRCHHHGLDARVEIAKAFENFNAGHARHANIKNSDIDSVILRDLDGRRPIFRHEYVKLVAEDDPQRHSRPLLIIDDQELGPGRLRQGGRSLFVKIGDQRQS